MCAAMSGTHGPPVGGHGLSAPRHRMALRVVEWPCAHHASACPLTPCRPGDTTAPPRRPKRPQPRPCCSRGIETSSAITAYFIRPGTEINTCSPFFLTKKCLLTHERRKLHKRTKSPSGAPATCARRRALPAARGCAAASGEDDFCWECARLPVARALERGWLRRRAPGRGRSSGGSTTSSTVRDSGARVRVPWADV